MIQDYFKLSMNNLRRRRVRSWLTMIGIIISIATIFVLISLSLGLDAAIKEQFRQLGSDKFFIAPKGQAGGPGAGGAVQLTIKDAEEIEKVKGVKDISYYTAGNAEVEFSNQKKYFMVIGIPTKKSQVYIETEMFKIDEGKFLKKGDIGKIMIGSSYKSGNVFNRPVKAGDKLVINGKEFQVIGIMQTLGNPSDDRLIYIPFDDFKDLFKTRERVDQIIVQTKSGEDIKQVAERVKKKLLNFRGLKEKNIDFEISTPEELLKSFGSILNIITGFLLGVAGISLLVGSIGIANTMYTSVLERTKEIGTMKAIGAKNSDILIIFVTESGLLGLIGGAIGIALGYGLGKVIEYIAKVGLGTNLLRIATPWYLIAGCLAFGFLIGAISGLLPAMQASKIKPADTLRYE